ncbi:fumarate hydratase [Pseudozyma hubeiensis SY62]|uniref:Fumarate hydratase n=1 Tax=Pseudozyma hubeiensis (strain SY62) TaxID=1305764 RepID=R9NXE0_PSEHS|nr:fumarate hydratase [Pseudozyma hubeiensis SY62]GAC93323.1 fumarate hydratase [Pseudozyma hubeiensis SY62]
MLIMKRMSGIGTPDRFIVARSKLELRRDDGCSVTPDFRPTSAEPFANFRRYNVPCRVVSASVRVLSRDPTKAETRQAARETEIGKSKLESGLCRPICRKLPALAEKRSPLAVVPFG